MLNWSFNGQRFNIKPGILVLIAHPYLCSLLVGVVVEQRVMRKIKMIKSCLLMLSLKTLIWLSVVFLHEIVDIMEFQLVVRWSTHQC